MRRTLLFSTMAFVAALGVHAAGCNQILGNEEGTLEAGTDAVSDAVGPTDDSGGPQTDGGGGGGTVCDLDAGHKECFNLCLSIDDPSYGCGRTSCIACDPKNVQNAKCVGGANGIVCGYDNCKPGFDNCDNNKGNGCEAALTTKENCGSCGTQCGKNGTPGPVRRQARVDSPAPTRSTGTTECTTSGACVNIDNDPLNCGGCGKVCERANADARCANQQCQYNCHAGTHDCGGVCVSDSDLSQCGPTCTKCITSAPNTVPVCTGTSCDVACANGWSNCDSDPKNGCETNGPCKTPPPPNCGAETCDNVLTYCCNSKCVPIGFLCGIGAGQ